MGPYEIPKRTDIVWSALANMVLWLAMLALDPFGVESATSASSRVLYQRVLAPFYPTTIQGSVAVVLIRDDDIPLLADGHAAWPPKFSEYAAILRNLSGESSKKPEAIFVDLLLDNQHNDDKTISELCDAAVELEARGIPVFFAEVPSPTGRDAGDLAISGCGGEIRLAGAGWVSGDGEYPLTTEIGGKNLMTAAAALYRNHLVVKNDVAGLRSFDGEVKSGAALSVQWGGAPPTNDPECTQIGATFADKMRASLRIAAVGSGVFGRDRGLFYQAQPCLFHSTYKGQSIARAGAFEKFGITDSLDGVTVFVGAQIDGIPDTLLSPVHGVAPGVFEHAMALDNLRTFGARYYRSAPEVVVGPYSVPQDAFLVAFLILALAGFLRTVDGPRLYKRTRAGLALAFAHKTLIAFIFTALIIFFIGLSHFAFRYEPFNWGSVFSIGMIMIFSRRFRRNDHQQSNLGVDRS